VPIYVEAEKLTENGITNRYDNALKEVAGLFAEAKGSVNYAGSYYAN